MNISIVGRWVWITGASSGIGSAVAREVAARGASVLLSGRDEERLACVAADCAAISKRGAFGASHEILAFDLLDRAARAAAVQKALAISGGFALVVLNAGISQRSSFENLSPEAFETIMELDFFAPVDMIRRLLPSFNAATPSGLVLVSSLAGLLPAPRRTAYVSAKHALSGFGGVLRGEVRERNIAVTNVYPGYARTGIARSALYADGRPRGKDDPHIEKGADPAKIAPQIVAAAQRGRAEIRVAMDFNSRLALYVSRHLPDLAAAMGARRGKKMVKGEERDGRAI